MSKLQDNNKQIAKDIAAAIEDGRFTLIQGLEHIGYQNPMRIVKLGTELSEGKITLEEFISAVY